MLYLLLILTCWLTIPLCSVPAFLSCSCWCAFSSWCPHCSSSVSFCTSCYHAFQTFILKVVTPQSLPQPPSFPLLYNFQQLPSFSNSSQYLFFCHSIHRNKFFTFFSIPPSQMPPIFSLPPVSALWICTMKFHGYKHTILPTSFLGSI